MRLHEQVLVGFPRLRAAVECAPTSADVRAAVHEQLAPLRRQLLAMCGVRGGQG